MLASCTELTLKGTLIFNFKFAANLWNLDAVAKIRQPAQHKFFCHFESVVRAYSLTATAAVACVSGQSEHPNVIIKLERFAAGSKCFSSFLLLDCLFYSSLRAKKNLKSHLKFKSSNISETMCILLSMLVLQYHKKQLF